MNNNKRRISSIPVCTICEDCYLDRSKTSRGMPYFCRLTEDYVGQEHFSLSSPKSCPKKGKN